MPVPSVLSYAIHLGGVAFPCKFFRSYYRLLWLPSSASSGG